jgi:hypothetical protein
MAVTKPGECRIKEFNYVASRTITDAKKELVIKSYTANPPAHVEFGRDYEN